MLRPDTFALTALLALLTGLGPLAMDLYLPSLPDIGRQLAAPPAQVQLTISGYLIGFAVGQIVYGPLADRYGRKPPLMAALALFCLATLLCAFARSIETLIAARALQAMGSSGAIVLARAIVRDFYHGPRAGRELSLMGMIMGFAPIVAPLIGGVLQQGFGWRSGFAVIFAGGVAAMTAVWWALPETVRRDGAAPIVVSDFFRSYRIVARNGSFLAHTGIVMASYAGLFAFISGASFVMQDLYGLTPIGFAVFMAITACGYLAGTFAAARIVERIGLNRTIGAGVFALAGGGLTLVVGVALAPHATAAVALPMMLYVAGLGLAAPQALAGAMQPFAQRAGAASSFLGCVQQTASAVMGAVVGHLLGASAWPLVISIAAMGALSFAVWALTRRVRTGRSAG
jgi:DHA1 family bicyclomycin/chloramphenicol resistance-like MFS transporter